MPSGAKKRKAAKKKKENQNQSHNHSDSATQTQGDEDVKRQDDREREVRDSSSAEGSRIDNGEEQVGVEESGARVEKEIKIEDELGVEDGMIDHDEGNRKPYDGGSSGSCGGSSSSDDECHGIKKEQAASRIASGSVEMADSLSGKSVEPVCDSLTAEAGDSIVESISFAIESDVLSEASISVAPRVVESTLKEKGEEKFSSVEERICTSVDAESYRKEEEANVGSAESSPKTLDPKECVTQENDDRSTSPCIAPRVALDNGAQHVKDSVVTQQPVAAPSPYPVQKTSLKSCCGLFEVFSGSGD